ncbi:MAG: 2-oxoacid:acceptor oxidoreductase family protein [Proteobacteria bacterium]|nr:2-oxoacid:acceptor oxidoreductase family protein [Pseudomonadota bacterium]
MYFDVIFAGFGGQGVMFIGNLLAEAAMADGRQVTYMPVYGVEMRGGTANCTVVVSDAPIGSPIIHNPKAAVVMNLPSLVKFGPQVERRGLVLVNASLISDQDVAEVQIFGRNVIMIPAIELAAEAGNDRLANMVMLGCLIAGSKVVSVDTVIGTLDRALDERYRSMIPVNAAALRAGAAFTNGN